MKTGTAHGLVHQAIADGQLQRGPCEICGSLATQGHHDDYFVPLAVRWLYSTHHAQWHKENPSPPSTPANKAKLTIYLPYPLLRALAKAAKSAHVSQSVYVMQVLQAHFKCKGGE